LETIKSNHAQDGLYDKADYLKIKIDEMRKTLKIQKDRILEVQHNSEFQSLEQNFKREIDEFTKEWENKFKFLEEQSNACDKALTDKHTKETEELYSYLEEKLSKNLKYSKEYLNLKSQEENLVKLQM